MLSKGTHLKFPGCKAYKIFRYAQDDKEEDVGLPKYFSLMILK